MKKQKTITEFKPFWFESNACWGVVDSLKTWREIVGWYKKMHPITPTSEIIKKARATDATEGVEFNQKPAPDKFYVPNFGYRREHVSKRTLEDWSKENGMYDALILI